MFQLNNIKFNLQNFNPRTGEGELFDPFAEDAETKTIVGDMQSSILKSHGRDRAILYFLKFNKKRIKEVKKIISDFAGYVTPFKLQLEEAKQFRKYGVPGGTIVNFFLSSKGYLALGEAKDEKALGEKFPDPYFIRGMGSNWVRDELKDADPTQVWEENYLEKNNNKTMVKEIHALLILADNDNGNLGQKVRFFLRDVLGIGSELKGEGLVEIVTAEHALLQRNDRGQVVEHFGYRDGISNPVFLKGEAEDLLKNGGYNKWDLRSPLDLVLMVDPYGKNGVLSLGSYLVYRKYEQHVKKFETLIKNLSMDLYEKSDSEKALEKIRALVMGRFRDGVPIAVKNEPGRYLNENYNNFNYEDDPIGSKCPLHAHIRKVNPRFSKKEKESQPQIVRRGMTYGERTKKNTSNLGSLPNQRVGLLFMSFQKSIESQFATMQRDFANNRNFPYAGTGGDTLIEQSLPNDKGLQFNESKRWPLEWDTPKHKYSGEISTFITLKGGEFFFAPSISFLKNLQ